jgi:hypothetical protein
MVGTGNLTPVDITAILAAVGALLTVILTKGMEAYTRWRDSLIREKRLRFELEQQQLEKTRAEEIYETKQIDLGTKFVMRKQDKRISQLEQELDSIRKSLLHCLEEHAEARVRIEFLEKQSSSKQTEG